MLRPLFRLNMYYVNLCTMALAFCQQGIPTRIQGSVFCVLSLDDDYYSMCNAIIVLTTLLYIEQVKFSTSFNNKFLVSKTCMTRPCCLEALFLHGPHFLLSFCIQYKSLLTP